MLSDQVDLQSEKLSEVEVELRDALSRLEGADARLQEVRHNSCYYETESIITRILPVLCWYSTVSSSFSGKLFGSDTRDMQERGVLLIVTMFTDRNDQKSYLVTLEIDSYIIELADLMTFYKAKRSDFFNTF